MDSYPFRFPYTGAHPIITDKDEQVVLSSRDFFQEAGPGSAIIHFHTGSL